MRPRFSLDRNGGDRVEAMTISREPRFFEEGAELVEA